VQARGCQGTPVLRGIVVEASQALALLDAQRLEELAFSCEALNRTLTATGLDLETRRSLARQSREAVADMVVLGRVLEATRANVSVMNRLREMRGERLEYKVQAVASDWNDAAHAESGDGNN